MWNPIVTISGLRGLVNFSFEQPALQYVDSFLELLPKTPKTIVLGYDGRQSGCAFRPLIEQLIRRHGFTPRNLEVAPTPLVGFAAQSEDVVGGVQITASHNTSEYNGIKLFDGTGRVISGQMGAAVLSRYQEKMSSRKWIDIYTLMFSKSEPLYEQALPQYVNRVLKTVGVSAIKKRRFRVLLDSNNGSGSVAKSLLERLNCDFTILGPDQNGKFLHTPEPTERNLKSVCHEVAERGCDIGFCQDPDADRLAIIDASGRYVGEEYTVALCIRRALQKRKGNVVINCASSQMSEDIARGAGFECFRSSVGEANVVDMMKAIGAVYGGEGNGGPIDPKVGYVRDSFVGIAQILDLMATSGKTIAQLVDEIHSYQIVKTKFQFPMEKLPELYRQVAEQFPKDQICRDDGLRLSNEDSWLLVRPSNTEPLVRVIAEAPFKGRAVSLCDRVAEIAEKIEEN